MLSAVERKPVPGATTHLVEVVSPRSATATIAAAENLLAAVSLPDPFSLEIAATDGARWFFLRGGSAAGRERLEQQLGAAYPQAEVRRLDLDRYPGLDPARQGVDERVAACVLVLREAPCLPLRTFGDGQADGSGCPADPVLGIIAAMAGLPPGWRALSQVVLRPAPDDWSRPYLPLLVERPASLAQRTDSAADSQAGVIGLAALGLLLAVGLQAYHWYATAEWGHLALLAVGLALAVSGLVWLARRLRDRPIYDSRLVREKVGPIAYRAQVRLAVFAPNAAPEGAVRARLDHLTAAYRQYNLAAGNGFVTRRLALAKRDLRDLSFLPPVRRPPVLTTRELAGLWHLPSGEADVPLLERSGPRRRLPLPYTVARGCRIGVSKHQDWGVPVFLPDELLRRHLLLVAKTRRGKSSLLLRLAQHLLTSSPFGERQAVVLVDPHRDLARAALGLVPPARRDDVVYLDASERERPFGLNLIDTGLGWDRDKAVANVLSVFRREFDRFWGPRMEDAFRFGLLSLYEANEAICAADPRGRQRQHTILQVPALLTDLAFRRTVTDLVRDPVVKAWWTGYFEPLDRRLQMEIVNPVQTKVQRFAGSRIARAIVGQPRSTLAPKDWLRSGAVVVVNTAKGEIGEDTAALIGGTLINLVGLLVGEQASLPEGERRRATLIVDEFHTMPGADYEAILSELAKYGANLVLATQSLARLDALDRDSRRALRSTVFANLDGLFAFHTSAEDARYLAAELGAEVDELDLVDLGEHRCYAKLSVGGERLPVFSIHLDPPPASDAAHCESLATASAAKYGRDQAAVEVDLRSALARVEACRRSPALADAAGAVGAGLTREVALGSPLPENKGGRGKDRNQNRKPKRPPVPHGQSTLFDRAPVTVADEGQPSLEEDPTAARSCEEVTL